MFPTFVPWDWLNLIVAGVLLSIGWQLGALVYSAVVGLFQRLARGDH